MRPKSLAIHDARSQEATLRVTGHPEKRKLVISHWRDDICVASTHVEVGELPALIGVLADTLGDVARSGVPAPTITPGDHGLLARVKTWWRPRFAQIIELRAAGRVRAGREETG